MSQTPDPRPGAAQHAALEVNVTSVIGEPEVLEDRLTAVRGTTPGPEPEVRDLLALARDVEHDPAWLELKAAAGALQELQDKDGSVPAPADHARAAALVETVALAVERLAPRFPHDGEYLAALPADLRRWSAEGLGVPDFLDSLVAFAPAPLRVDGLRHLVVFPMVTQNGSPDRHLEALIVEGIWPESVAELEASHYDNALFVSLRLVDFTAGYATNSAVLFPETVAMREIPQFTWGAIFQDREAARFRRVVTAAAEITRLDVPDDLAILLADQHEAEHVFVMWDLIHDRTHMRGDLPFDPFMIKQRMPYFLYSLEELRCDLTAFREAVAIEERVQARLVAGEDLTEVELCAGRHARGVQYAVVLDRIFRFALTGSRVRNYDGLGGQLLFAWLHQRHVVEWTDVTLRIDWQDARDAVIALGDAIEELYWTSIDRPKVVHWLAAYDLVRGVLAPHPASVWAAGLPREVLAGPPKGYTDAVLDDEFPLSMFHEALGRKLRPVIDACVGITGTDG